MKLWVALLDLILIGALIGYWLGRIRPIRVALRWLAPKLARHTGGNAEDCPRCTGRRDLAYPFICPGQDPDTTEETETP